ncbi:MAG: thiamine-phosphate kinase, partial [Syntrophomonadaceae bacterium]|nr:thiamine-phosphate kinase [Syntrophomonadaceae bacterium]
MRISEVGESGLLQRIREWCGGPQGADVVVGIGDDAAAVRVPAGTLLLLTTDMLVEGIHFLPGLATPGDIGYKALAANLSDIAAMGGTPGHVVVSLALPPATAVEDLHQFYLGLLDLAREHAVTVVGGDVTASRQGMVISLAVSGWVAEAQLVRQEGARAGDLLAVTGPLGASAAGLVLLQRPALAVGEAAAAAAR